MTQKLTAEQRVQRAHITLMRDPKYCLYSGVFMIGDTQVKDDVPTACTDGYNTYYGRKFVEQLPEPELHGLILHENLHKAFRHSTVWQHLYEQDAALANQACDYVINLLIVDSDPHGDKVRLPKGGLIDQQYRGMDAGSIFRALQQQKKQQSKEKANGQGDGDGEAGEDESNASGQEGFDEHDWSAAKAMSESEKQQHAREIDQALRQGAILAGKMGGNIPQQIGEVMESKVDWRTALAEFITALCTDKDISTYRRPNRRHVAGGVYLPSTIGERVGRVVIAADMSGSMWGMLGSILGEVKKICETVRPEGIDLIYWDASVCAVEKYDIEDLDNLLATTKPAGGGGTSPQCVADYLREHKITPECIIMLTDGYVDNWGKGWNAPIFWGITTKGITAGNGVSIHLGE